MTYLKLAWKFAPWIAIALLLGAVLWLRGDIIDAKAERDAARVQVDGLTDANKSLNDQIGRMEQARKDNDAIWSAMAAAFETNRSRESIVRETITKEIRDDPATRAWADTAVPDSVRAALRKPDPVDPPAR